MNESILDQILLDKRILISFKRITQVGRVRNMNQTSLVESKRTSCKSVLNKTKIFPSSEADNECCKSQVVYF
jgi:hypothetical protein